MQKLNEIGAEKILGKYLPVCKSKIVVCVEDAKLLKGYPKVLKVISDDALHKTEFNLVRIVHNDAELESNFGDLIKTIKNKKFKCSAILVQEYVNGQEIIIGLKKDAVFGHVVLVGMGGILTEVLKDISIRKCPIDEEQAISMLKELKGYVLLSGFRGKKVNLDLLSQIIVKVSRLPEKVKNISELDINPFIINEKEGKVCDARIILE